MPAAKQVVGHQAQGRHHLSKGGGGKSAKHIERQLSRSWAQPRLMLGSSASSLLRCMHIKRCCRRQQEAGPEPSTAPPTPPRPTHHEAAADPRRVRKAPDGLAHHLHPTSQREVAGQGSIREKACQSQCCLAVRNRAVTDKANKGEEERRHRHAQHRARTALQQFGAHMPVGGV
jgi:hypothetical protein